MRPRLGEWIADSGNRPHQLSIDEITWPIPGIGYPHFGTHPTQKKSSVAE